MDQRVLNFFRVSDAFDYLVTRQLGHIKSNWELTWDREEERFESEEDSYADILNELIIELSNIEPPKLYHDNEDQLAEYCRDSLNWNIFKDGRRWKGMEYVSILEQGGFDDVKQGNLCLSVSGRIRAAIIRGQLNFDDMEESHQRILADVIAIILYHRS